LVAKGAIADPEPWAESVHFVPKFLPLSCHLIFGRLLLGTESHLWLQF
jgi:hypothetical protein